MSPTARSPPATTCPMNFYRNDGNGTFTDVAPELGVDDMMPSFQAIFFDSDRDGDVDLYLSTDKGYHPLWNNRLFENVDGTLIEISEGSGANISIDSMGVAVGDMSGNLQHDVYCANTPGGNVLLLNEGGNVFVNSTAAAGVASDVFGWGTQFFDFDNDTFLDLYVCSFDAANRLYQQEEGAWPPVDVADGMGVANAGPRSRVAGQACPIWHHFGRPMK